jgi:hypothetical protein
MSAVEAVANTATRTTPRRSVRTSSGRRGTSRTRPAQAGGLLLSGGPLPRRETVRTEAHRVGPPAADISTVLSAVVSRP